LGNYEETLGNYEETLGNYEEKKVKNLIPLRGRSEGGEARAKRGRSEGAKRINLILLFFPHRNSKKTLRNYEEKK
jgi:hypothetical protein